jgi:hypothetical protein
MQKGKSNKESFFSHCVHEKSLSRRKSRNRERKKGEIYLKADAEKNMRWKFKLRIVI